MDGPARQCALPWVLAAFGLLAAAAAAGDELAWSLYPRTCEGQVVSALRVPCGGRGVLHFAPGSDGGCPPTAAGSEVPRLYPLPAVRVLAAPHDPGTVSGSAGTASGGPGTAPGSSAGRRGMAASAPLPHPTPSPPPPWLAVIDWDDDHGESVVSLVELLAAGAGAAVLYPLDGADLAPLGEHTGDPHLLARLCQVAEDAQGSGVPLAVNMSFGRLPGPGEEAAAASCDAGRLSCQIARGLDHLRDLGALPVAAAGNHQRLLFPAVLGEALAAASLDVSWFLAGQLPDALWEAPGGAEVLLPGHALCVDGAVVPAGSSYASALFAGWYAFFADSDPPADAFAGTWAPVWDAGQGCWALGQSGEAYGACNPGLDDAVAGLVGGLASGCWGAPGAGGKPVLTVAGPGAPQPRPALTGFDEWAARQLHPAPESDPCIPCVDGGYSAALTPTPATRSGAGSDDVMLNLSSSLSVDPALRLDRVYFRVGQDFYLLDLAPADLAALEQGAVGGLLLAGYGVLLPSPRQPSLVYVFRSDPAADCAGPAPDPNACFWSSTPVFLP